MHITSTHKNILGFSGIGMAALGGFALYAVKTGLVMNPMLQTALLVGSVVLGALLLLTLLHGCLTSAPKAVEDELTFDRTHIEDPISIAQPSGRESVMPAPIVSTKPHYTTLTYYEDRTDPVEKDYPEPALEAHDSTLRVWT